ncbi:MAG: hypothetical protein KJP23_21430 [Deltaproteobacteria bacterium]|nr:hypothetical protein [Deltaproteobacteria bacterium]
MIVVKPETVIRWHRKGFKLFWRFKSRRKGPGWPQISTEIRDLILKMANANPLWAAPRFHGELLKLGICIHKLSAVQTFILLKARKKAQTDQGLGGDVFVEATA